MAAQGDVSGPIGGRYDVVRRLGAGATAVVYLGRDRQTGSEVAVKLLRLELAQSGAAERFLKEIRRTGALDHARILPVMDSGEHEGERPFFVMPFMEGGTLRQRLERERQLPIPEAIVIARQIAEALDYANERGLIHRDVKPENILFTKGEARLADFGIARALQTVYGDGTTSSATIRGTPAYMSPEQASGSDRLGGKSDQYSLACVVYEMIAGMQAFMGPTPEAVMAQRFLHTPRDVNVFRPTAPAGIGPVMTKAFALAPADRYTSCVDFVEALATAPTSGAVPHRKQTVWPRVVGAAAAVLLVAAMGAQVLGVSLSWGRADRTVDSTRIALFPLERDSVRPPAWRDDDLLQQGFSRWRGISTVDQYQIADALRRRGPIATGADATTLSRELGAGRYMRGRVTSMNTYWRVTGSLYDVASDQALYSAAVTVPAQIDGAVEAYARLADSLLLRGASADSVPALATGSRSLPAVQAFSRAQLALDEWDLAAADSGFQAAVATDPEYARAELWLAQVRAWGDRPRGSWGAVAERAAVSKGQLTERESRLAEGLSQLASGRYAEACATYEDLTRRNDRDFAAWFGVGQCHTMDRLVIPTAASPSGWAYRSSRHRAMQAYERAFEILPSVHRGYDRGAFERLQVVLLLRNRLSTGYGTDSTLYLSRPGWIGDSLVLVPFSFEVASAGGPQSVPPGFATALVKQREQFRRVALRWSAAFPASGSAKEAVAISLDLLGDPRAVDTLRLARRLTPDSTRAFRLASREVLLAVKYGMPDTVALASAMRLADTLLASTRIVAPGTARQLAPLAALAGACRRAEALVRESDIGFEQPADRDLIAAAYATLTTVATGCGGDATRAAIRAIAGQVEARYRNRPTDQRTRAVEQMLARPLLLGSPLDSQLLARFANGWQNPLAIAARLATVNDRAKALATLRGAQEVEALGPLTPEMVLAKALLLTRLGDTLGAVTSLRSSLDNVRMLNTDDLAQPEIAGALGRAMSFLAILTRDSAPDVARKWNSAIRTLWSGADPVLSRTLR